MKKALKSAVALLLSLLARLVIRRYHPYIVMVTGSVGKTSTKDAVAAVLGARFTVRKSEKSFNSEFGVPFTILGVSNPWADPRAWLHLIKRAIALLTLPNRYPTMLVLEVGADKPGDLSRILRIAKPDAVVVTRLPEVPVHVEAYASPEEVREEEFSPALALRAGAPLIVSSDDTYALALAAQTPAHIISYGNSKGATVRIHKIGFYEEGKHVLGMKASMSLHDREEDADVVVRGSVGTTQIYPAAAALAAAVAFDIPTGKAIEALASYEPPAGRGRLFAGKNGALIIDDSYNASPVAVESALLNLKAFPHAKRRIAVLGDMLELGRYSVSEHERIGILAREAADIVVAIGIRSRAFGVQEGKAQVLPFDNSKVAAGSIAEMLQAGDVVLVKGSQSIRTELIVKELLADPADASRLVRQDTKWQERG